MVFFRKDLFTKQEVAAFKRLVEDVPCISMVWPRMTVDTVLAGDFCIFCEVGSGKLQYV